MAENAIKFALDEAPMEAGMPSYGNPFITTGFIYPPGTLSDLPGDGTLDDGVVIELDEGVMAPEESGHGGQDQGPGPERRLRWAWLAA